MSYMKINVTKQKQEQMVRDVFRLFAGRKPTPAESQKFVQAGTSRDAVKAYALAQVVKKEPEWAVAPPGVHWSSPWGLAGNGLCTVCRRQAVALAGAGVAVRLLPSAAWGGPDARTKKEVEHLLQTHVSPHVRISGFVLDGRIDLRVRGVTRPNQIVTGMLERDRISASAAQAANQIAQWWLPCPANIEAFARSGVDPQRLKLVPVPFLPDDPVLGLTGRTREPGPPRFYHVGTIGDRKGQARWFLNFLRAFRPGQAQLVIKTTYSDPGSPGLQQFRTMHLTDKRVVANGWTKDNISQPHVDLVHAVWPEEKITALHRWGDVYLSLARGEGWDMPAFAAILAGNLLVYTPSGGPQSFACESDLQVSQTGWEKCNPVYGWEKDAQWITYDDEHCVDQLRVAADNLPDKKHRRDFTPYTVKTVGNLMRSYLEPLLT